MVITDLLTSVNKTFVFLISQIKEVNITKHFVDNHYFFSFQTT